MRSIKNFFQVQDSIVKISPNSILGTPNKEGLKIERNIINLETLTRDTVREVPKKKIIPLVKTVPYVPVSDSIEHPSYDVLSESFKLHDESTFFDQLSFVPFDPKVTSKEYAIKFVKATQPVAEKKTFEVKESIKKENLISAQSKAVGFLSTDWMLGIIIFSLILFGWLRVGYNRFFQAAILASYNYFAARRIFEEGNITRSRVFYFMNILFFVNLALFSAQYLSFHQITLFKLDGIYLFLISLGVFVLLYSFKSLVLYILDFLFLSRGGFSSYVFTVFLYNKMIGILLLPIVAVLPYVPLNVTPWLFWVGGVIVLFLYIFRVFKGLQLCFKNRLSIFYLFLYLCALEILPVLLLVKIVYGYL